MKTKKILVGTIAILVIVVCLFASNAIANRGMFEGEWEMGFIFDGNGEVLYCSEENANTYPDAEPMDLECVVENGDFTLQSGTRSCTGTLNMQRKKYNTAEYEATLVFDGREYKGIAVASYVGRFNVFSKKSTLSISLVGETDSYCLNFYR